MWDDVLTRELIEFPEKWLSTVGRIENDERVRRILFKTEQLYPGMLKVKYNIEPSEEIGAARDKLGSIIYGGLSAQEIDAWKGDTQSTRGWPTETSDRLEKLLSM